MGSADVIGADDEAVVARGADEFVADEPPPSEHPASSTATTPPHNTPRTAIP
jgi:hypothetical protein